MGWGGEPVAPKSEADDEHVVIVNIGLGRNELGDEGRVGADGTIDVDGRRSAGDVAYDEACVCFVEDQSDHRGVDG
jgi:hypothetical protein